jgi:AraC-like DNA-binding protein
VTVVSDARAGLAALGAPDGLAAVLDAGVATVRGVDPIVGRLRDHLAARLAEATMAGACSALGLSERTLQRRLTEAGTSFRAELTSARLKAAARRLTDTQDPITAIALDAGFSSLQHFSTKFSEVFGRVADPVARARARRGGARGGRSSRRWTHLRGLRAQASAQSIPTTKATTASGGSSNGSIIAE